MKIVASAERQRIGGSFFGQEGHFSGSQVLSWKDEAAARHRETAELRLEALIGIAQKRTYSTGNHENCDVSRSLARWLSYMQSCRPEA